MLTLRLSVVIPTRDRRALLRRCLDAVLEQQSDVAFEVVVVNDAGCPIGDIVVGDERVSLVEGSGRGPAAARNAGIALASGDIVLFTDDDVIPQPGWIQAAIAAMAQTPHAVGVVGRVESPAYDPLYEHSVSNGTGLGCFLTCNVAYRRTALKAVLGFDEGFPYPAEEDRDLGYRMQQLGPVVFCPEMLVVHPPRTVGMRDVIRRGRFVEAEWRLHTKHPQTRPPRWSTRWGPIVRYARNWQRLLCEEHVIRGSSRRGARFVLLAGGQLSVALAMTLRSLIPGRAAEGARSSSSQRGLRIAWVGPTPRREGGVAECAWLLVAGLARAGCEIDCYLSDNHDDLPTELYNLDGVRIVNFDTGWRFDRWYSNNSVTKVLTGLGARAWGRRRLATLVLEQHCTRPYDVLYQFSTIELFGLRRKLGELPPLVVHPETHMAGELRGVRSERHLAARCQSRWRRLITESLLATRAYRQHRDIGLADGVIAISRRFGELLVADYGVDPQRVTLVPNPIDLDALQSSEPKPAGRPRHVAFVSRMSARKGLEFVIELSHRLDDLAGEVVLDLVGGETLWSDYRPLLADLNPRVARYHGHMLRPQLFQLLGDTDMLIQPATYEPFGLTVGEALACGVPVVATEEVGAAEQVSSECCLIVPAGDVGALEAAVRQMLDRLAHGEGPAMRRSARREAERLYAPKHVVRLTEEALSKAATPPGRKREVVGIADRPGTSV